MEQSTIDRLIINKPYEEPAEHWRYNRETRESFPGNLAAVRRAT